MKLNKSSGYNVSEHLKSCVESISNAYESSRDDCFNTGVIALQQKINGIPKGRLTKIASCHDGDRLLAYQIVCNLLRQDVSVLLFSNQLSGQNAMMHIIANISGVETHKLVSGMLEINDWSRMLSSIDTIKKLPLSIYDEFRTSDAVLSCLNDCETPFQLIVIDGMAGTSRDSDIYFYEALSLCAKNSQSAIIVLFGSDSPYGLSNLKDDIDEYFNLSLYVACPDHSKKKKVSLQILKNRFFTLNEQVNLSVCGDTSIISSLRYDYFKGYECSKRQVVLNCETTGLSPEMGHRIIEISALEMIDQVLTGRSYHQYINPCLIMDEYVINIHGISNDVLVDKPVFSAIFNEFMSFINGAELIIHHANFDINFFNSEFRKMGISYLIEDKFKITDTRIMAKTKYPNEKMSVDALCHLMNIEHNSGDIDDGLAYCENVANIYLSLIGKTS